jgi:hypothetical protein
MMTRVLRSSLQIGRAVLAVGMSLAAAATALGESSKVVSIEEHWELQLSQPDSERSAPQVTMVMAPKNDISGTHFLFTLNHVTLPSYQPGGMQVQAWEGEDLSDAKAGSNSAALENSNEAVRWTQKISIQDGTLTFQIVNGESETWNTFGGDDLSISVPSTIEALNGYRPSVSLSESQVGYAENRVTSLTLTKLVWTTDDGQVHEQNAPIPIDTSLGD